MTQMNKAIHILLFCIIFSGIAMGQSIDGFQYLDIQKSPCKKEKAHFYRIIIPQNTKTNHYTIRDYFINGKLNADFQVKSNVSNIDWQKYKRLAISGVIRRDGYYRTYYDNGQLKYQAHYHNNQKTNPPFYWLKNGEPAYFAETWTNARPAQFPGGKCGINTYILSKINHHKLYNHKKKLFVSIAIDRRGNVCYAEAQNSIDPNTDAGIIQIIQAMPRWKPAKLNGKKVNTFCTIPISVGADGISGQITY